MDIKGQSRFQRSAAPFITAGILLVGIVSASAAVIAPGFSCSVIRTDSTLEVTWDSVDGITEYQYKLSEPGKGNRYRRVPGTSISLTVDDPAATVIAMTPVGADGTSPPRVNCDDATDTTTTTPSDSLCSVEAVDGGVLLRWDAIPGAVGYQYKASVEGEGNRYVRLGLDIYGETFIQADATVTVSFRPYFAEGEAQVRREPCGSATPTGIDSTPSNTAPSNTVPINTVPINTVPVTIPVPPVTERPPSTDGVFISTDGPVRENFDSSAPDAGPQCVTPGNTSSRPGLRYGDFLMFNSSFGADNAKGDFFQCLSLIEQTDGSAAPRWDFDWLNRNSEQDYRVRSFPEVIYGTKARFESSQVSDVIGLPAQYEELPQFQIDYDYELTQNQRHQRTLEDGRTINGEQNVVIESFFHSSCDIRRGSTGSNREFEIMLWLERGPERNPDGQAGYRQNVVIDGAEYEVWTKGEKDPAYIAFVAVETQTAGSINWTSFIEWARDNGEANQTRPFDDSWCLANIIFGTEIWWGSGSFQLNQFDVTRRY